MKWLIGLIVFVGVTGWAGSRYYDIASSPDVSVVVDGKEVFRGNGACVHEKILDGTVVVDVGEGPLCLSARWPKPTGRIERVQINTVP